MTSWVVVSPHLDDAVLSCAGAIRQQLVRGHRVIVVTVFSEGADSERRRRQDAAALASLGAEPIHLGLLDAPERLGLARTHRALVEDAVVDEADVARARAAIRSIGERVYDACMWAPLGVGEHIDHRVVHAALADWPSVVFYEERPYAFLAGAVRARLAALGLSAPGLEAPPEAALVREQIATLPHLGAYLASRDDGERARAWLHARVTSPAHPGSRTEVRADVTTYDAAIAAAVTRAVAFYEPDVGELFGDAERIGPSLLAASRGLDALAVHAERTFSRLR